MPCLLSAHQPRARAAMRLDRLLSNLPAFSRSQARLLISQGQVQVNGQVCRDVTFAVRSFDDVEVAGQCLQTGIAAKYLMLNKPSGVVSATVHDEHLTVLDLLPENLRHDLHIAGRLDLTTTGLLILTNDGLWSRRLTNPGSNLGKRYLVHTEQPITEQYIQRFAKGLYFAFEDLTTLPAQLEILTPYSAYLTLHEGRYHQVKRMFGHFQNKVIGLHREQMGPIVLDKTLKPGQWRYLSEAEIAAI